jgi:hypothetical protein
MPHRTNALESANRWEKQAKIPMVSAEKAKFFFDLRLAGGTIYRHIVAARYRDLRLRSRRPSWAFPP